VAWQIMDLSENPTTLVLDGPRNVAKLNCPDKTLGIRIKNLLFQIIERMKNHLFQPQLFQVNLLLKVLKK
jgi:L-threonylcarbamoyladenylate synthase